MSSADTARAHYDSDDAEGKHINLSLSFVRSFDRHLGYRQQLREKSQPVCSLVPFFSSICISI